MNKQDKALAGDGLATLIIAEVKIPSQHVGYNIRSIYSSNEVFAKCYCLLKGIKYDTKLKIEYGTEYEAMLYDIFKNEGYQEAKDFFIRTVILTVDETIQPHK
jgi:hypothetical protein